MPSILWNFPQTAGYSTTQNQWWGTAIVTEPTSEPVDLDTVKSHIRVDWDDEDELIGGYIKAARQYCEDVCGRRFMTQTWDLWIQQWPAGNRIYIPYPPLISVEYVNYTDSTESVNILDSSTYVVNNAGSLGEVVLRFGQIWTPSVLSPSRPVNVRFDCGYGDAFAVPQPIKQAILLLIGHWYANRESVIIGRTATATVQVQDTVDALLARYKMYSYSPDPLRP